MHHQHCRIFSCDEDFVREIKAGGPRAETAISCLYLKYRKRAFAYFQRMIIRHEEFKGSTEDLVHDSFIVMLDKIQHESYPVQSLAGFWIGIGKNLFLNQLKKDQRTILVNDPEAIYASAVETSTWLISEEDENDQLDIALSRLCDRCREILVLWINRYTMAEITQIMKLTNIAMARKTKYECFKKLKEIVKTGNIPGA